MTDMTVTIRTPLCRVEGVSVGVFRAHPDSLLHEAFLTADGGEVTIPVDWLDERALLMLLEAYREGRIRVQADEDLRLAGKVVDFFRLPRSSWPPALVWQRDSAARIAQAAKPVIASALETLAGLPAGTPQFMSHVTRNREGDVVVPANNQSYGHPPFTSEVDLRPLARAVKEGLVAAGYCRCLVEKDNAGLFIAVTMPAVEDP